VAAGNIEAEIDNPPGFFDRVVFGGEDFLTAIRGRDPRHSTIVCDPVQMRPDGFKRDHHLRNGVLNFGMVSHRPGERKRTLALRGSMVLSRARLARP